MTSKGKNTTMFGRKAAVSGREVLSIVKSIEQREQGMKVMVDEIQEIYSKAKDAGYDLETLREIVRLRKLGSANCLKQHLLLDDYWAAMGEVFKP